MTRHVNRELRPGFTLILNPKGPNRAVSQTDSAFNSEKSAEAGIAKAFECSGRVSKLSGLPLLLAGCGINFGFISILWLYCFLCGSGVSSISTLAGFVPPSVHAGSCIFPRETDLKNLCATHLAVDLISLPDRFVSTQAKAGWETIQR